MLIYNKKDILFQVIIKISIIKYYLYYLLFIYLSSIIIYYQYLIYYRFKLINNYYHSILSKLKIITNHLKL